jgi:hypothetical protein
VEPVTEEPPPLVAAVDEPPPEPIASRDLSEPEARAQAAVRLDETIRLYRDTMQYPLWSRPADGSNAHLTHWNHPISVGQPFAVDAARREIQATAQIDRIFAAPGQAIAVTAALTYVDDGAPAPGGEVGAEVQWRDRQRDEWITAQVVPLERRGASWSGAIVPAEVAALRAAVREARVLVYTRLGEYEREHTLDFSYAITSPVVVRGLSSDRVVEGSLELGLEVELATADPVALQATLFHAESGQPIAVFDDRYFARRAGRQIIPVRFFGKALRERGLDGPYRLGAIHGYVYRRELVPDQHFFDRAEAPALRTTAHRAADFSADAYQSPEVAARLAHYEALREALRQGRPPPPPPPSPPPSTPFPSSPSAPPRP